MTDLKARKRIQTMPAWLERVLVLYIQLTDIAAVVFFLFVLAIAMAYLMAGFNTRLERAIAWISAAVAVIVLGWGAF